MILWLLLLTASAADSPAEWTARVEAARAAVERAQVDAPAQIRALEGRSVSLPGGGALEVRDPLLGELADALDADAPAGRLAALRHLAGLARAARALEAAPPLPEISPAPSDAAPPEDPIAAGPLRSLRGRILTAGEQLRAWGGDARGQGAAQARLLIAGIAAMGLLAGALLAVRRELPVEDPLAPPDAPRSTPQAPDGSGRGVIRAIFLATLDSLSRSGAVSGIEGRSNGQIEAQLDGALASSFGRARRAYERAWYGGHEPTPADIKAVDDARELARRPR